SILFVIYRAPDLALTQLVIETVSVALFLLCFYHLPQLKKRDEKLGSKVLNAMIAMGIGALMTLIGISAYCTNWYESISYFFIDKLFPFVRGNIIVNYLYFYILVLV